MRRRHSRRSSLRVTIAGAAGPTGLWACRLALEAGHHVTAISRRDTPLPLPAHARLVQVRADAVTAQGLSEAVDGADAILSTLGTAYTRRSVDVYSRGTHHLVEALRRCGAGRRLVVVSSGLTYPPPRMNPAADLLLFPFLRHVLGRTLYADMRAMEDELRRAPDIAWTVMRPGRLIDAAAVSAYRLDLDHPSQGYTTRPDLAAAMVAELASDEHVHRAVSPTTDRAARRR